MYSLLTLYNSSSSYISNFKLLAVFCDCTDRFESNLVGNPIDQFSHIMDHVMKAYQLDIMKTRPVKLKIFMVIFFIFFLYSLKTQVHTCDISLFRRDLPIFEQISLFGISKFPYITYTSPYFKFQISLFEIKNFLLCLIILPILKSKSPYLASQMYHMYAQVVLTSTHNLCFRAKIVKKKSKFFQWNFPFLLLKKISLYCMRIFS